MSQMSDEREIIVCLDFDGVINDYPGWQDEGYTVIFGEPIKGTAEAVAELMKKYRVIVNSARCRSQSGTQAIKKYLKKYNIVVDAVVRRKPRADIYLDDRGVRFEGRWKNSLKAIDTLAEKEMETR